MELDSVGRLQQRALVRLPENKSSYERFRRKACGTGRTKSFGIWTTTLVPLIFLACVQIGASLKCYHCLERPKSTEKHLACAYFDMSDKFHKECTHSSFCMKRTSQFQLHNGSYVTIHVHKCADQSHKTMVQDENGDWKWAQLFRRDLYNEGCFPHNTPSMLTTDSYHCFCSTDFCNGASPMAGNKNKVFLVSSGVLLAFFMTCMYLNPTL